MPAMGARTTGGATVCGPIRSGAAGTDADGVEGAVEDVVEGVDIPPLSRTPAERRRGAGGGRPPTPPFIS
ncbi:hypothetical protein GCM10027075_50270 [Streptomyces heilongjiangensis]